MLAAALPFVFVWIVGFPAGDDWQLELARSAAYTHALRDGQLPPFWAHSLYAGYGSPIFLFYGHGFLALASALSVCVRGVGASFLLALALAAMLGSFTFQSCASAALAGVESAKARAAARVGAVLYLTNPYLLCDLLLRNAASEFTALMWMPLALYGLWRSELALRAALWLAIGLALTLATHLLSAMLLIGLTVLFVVAEQPRSKQLSAFCAAALLACALTAYAWMPVLAYRSQLRAADLLAGKFSFRANFQPVFSLFDGTTLYSAGPLALAAAVAALISLRRAGFCGPLLRRVRGLLLCFALLVLLQLPLSAPVWETLPGLAFLQFPWRLMGPLALVTSLLGSCAFHVFTCELSGSKRAAAEAVIFALSLMATAPQLHRTRTIAHDELTRFEAMLVAPGMSALRFTATARDEYLPPAARWDRVHAPAQSTPLVSGAVGTRGFVTSDMPRILALDVDAQQDTKLCLARWAYPGWRVAVDGVDCDEQTCSPCAGGQLGVLIPAGPHHVRAELEAPLARQWGLAISAMSAVATLGWVFVIAFRRRSVRRAAAALGGG